MTPLQIVLTVVAATVILIIAISLTLAILILKGVSGSRCDKNPLLKYFTADDFSLIAKPVEVPYVNKKKKKLHLRGYIYKNEGSGDSGKLIVFCHGMGPGHIAYTTEIAYFCSLGHTVLALDNTGCNLSDGKNIRGFHAGVEAAEAAVDYADELGYKKIYLVGHSLGAYSALRAAKTRQVEGVVAISAPDVPAKAIATGAKKALPAFLVNLAYPFILLLLAGKNNSAAEGARYAATPVLLIHGDRDEVISRQNAVFYRANGEHIEKYLAEGKAHNPYNTVNAEAKLKELTTMLATAKKGANRAFFKKFDFAAATEEDDKVMQKIADFIDKN